WRPSWRANWRSSTPPWPRSRAPWTGPGPSTSKCWPATPSSSPCAWRTSSAATIWWTAPRPACGRPTGACWSWPTPWRPRREDGPRRTWGQRFSWAAADGRQLRQHHLHGLRRFLQALQKSWGSPAAEADPSHAWLRAEEDAETTAARLADWAARLDA